MTCHLAGVPNCQNLMSDDLRCCMCVCHSAVSNSLWSHGLLQLTRFLCPWNSPGKNSGVDRHSLLQGIFLTQGSNTGLQHCRQILYHLSHQGSPYLRYIISVVSLQCRRWGFNPWVGRPPGEGNGNPCQCSCLENPMDRGAWWATYSPWGHKESDTTERLSTCALLGARRRWYA